jgi:hypothetical protein
MLRRPGIAVAAILAGSISLPGQGPPTSSGAAAAPPRGTGLITGRVVDPAGAPIGSAIVGLGGAMPATRVLADADGRFFFSDLPAGRFTLDASKPGWIGGGFGLRWWGGATVPIDLATGERRGGLTITMWRYAVISGRVLDDTGDPLVGVDVRVAQQKFVAGHRQATFTGRAITDDRGVFRFSNLTPGDYLVVVPMDVTSEPATFSGAIRAAGETPHAYLQTMTAVGTAPLMLDRARVVAGGKSLVSSVSALPGPPPDGVWLTYPTTFFPSTLAIGSAAAVHAVSGEDKSGVDVVVRLTPTYQVSGVVSGPDGPAASYAVHLVPAESADAPLFDAGTAITDAAGAFTFFGVPPGQYVARVVRTPWPTAAGGRLAIMGGTGQTSSVGTILGGPGPAGGPPPLSTEPLLSVSQAVTVADRHVKDLALTLRAGGRVTGRAEFDGSASRPTPEQWRAASVALELANGQSSFAIFPGQFTADGQFATPSTWPGRYLIRAGAAPPGWTFKSATYQGRNVSETPIDIATADLEDVVITFTDHPRKIDGSVQVPQGQTGAGVVVLLFPVEPAGWTDYGRSSRRVRRVRASPTGTFTVASPPDGEYFLIAIPDEQAADWQNPALFTTLGAIADRIHVREGQSMTHALTLRRVQ